MGASTKRVDPLHFDHAGLASVVVSLALVVAATASALFRFKRRPANLLQQVPIHGGVLVHLSPRERSG